MFGRFPHIISLWCGVLGNNHILNALSFISLSFLLLLALSSLPFPCVPTDFSIIILIMNKKLAISSLLLLALTSNRSMICWLPEKKIRIPLSHFWCRFGPKGIAELVLNELGNCTYWKMETGHLSKEYTDEETTLRCKMLACMLTIRRKAIGGLQTLADQNLEYSAIQIMYVQKYWYQ